MCRVFRLLSRFVFDRLAPPLLVFRRFPLAHRAIIVFSCCSFCVRILIPLHRGVGGSLWSPASQPRAEGRAWSVVPSLCCVSLRLLCSAPLCALSCPLSRGRGTVVLSLPHARSAISLRLLSRGADRWQAFAGQNGVSPCTLCLRLFLFRTSSCRRRRARSVACSLRPPAVAGLQQQTPTAKGDNTEESTGGHTATEEDSAGHSLTDSVPSVVRSPEHVTSRAPSHAAAPATTAALRTS